MKRYTRKDFLAGASWAAEYGDPNTDDWSFLRDNSPYQVLRHDVLGLEGEDKKEDTPEGGRAQGGKGWTCPKVLFTTSTRDDRVHPAHARKMVRSLLEEAQPAGCAPTVLYWENVEGGHGGAADPKQQAFMLCVYYEFVKRTVGAALAKDKA